MQYEVSLVVEGATARVPETHTNEGAAYAAADLIAQEAEQQYGSGEGESGDDKITWHVYVTPHHCRHDEDCICSTWLPDHKPYRSG